MNKAIVTFEDLQRLANRTRVSSVRKYLKNNQIMYREDADGRPWTTATALNRSLECGRTSGPNWSALNDLHQERLQKR